MTDHGLLDNLAIFGAEYLYLVILGSALVWYLLQPRSRQFEMIAWGVAALPVLVVVLIVAGIVYYDPRPFVSDNVVPLIPHDADNGFPSDHTLICSATASIVFFYDKRFSGSLWLLTALVGASRVYTGVHHTLDILASAVLASTVTAIVWIFVLPLIKGSRTYSKISP
jgi:undecaprenyl-diphosphatase